MTKRAPDLSIVIPVYNESKRLHNLIQLQKLLKSLPVTSELILVDDGSQDDTAERLTQLSLKMNLTCIHYSPNKGKGYAIKNGMTAARGKWCGFMDIDMSTAPSDIKKFLYQVSKSDVVIGSRRLSQSRIIIHQSLARELMGQAFTRLTRLILSLDCSDFTCGCKFFSRNASQKIFSALTVERWAFDAEILFLARKFGFDVVEIPVTWKNDVGSKVRLSGDSLKSFMDLIKIRWNNFAGVY